MRRLRVSTNPQSGATSADRGKHLSAAGGWPFAMRPRAVHPLWVGTLVQTSAKCALPLTPLKWPHLTQITHPKRWNRTCEPCTFSSPRENMRKASKGSGGGGSVVQPMPRILIGKQGSTRPSWSRSNREAGLLAKHSEHLKPCEAPAAPTRASCHSWRPHRRPVCSGGAGSCCCTGAGDSVSGYASGRSPMRVTIAARRARIKKAVLRRP